MTNSASSISFSMLSEGQKDWHICPSLQAPTQSKQVAILIWITTPGPGRSILYYTLDSLHILLSDHCGRAGPCQNLHRTLHVLRIPVYRIQASIHLREATGRASVVRVCQSIRPFFKVNYSTLRPAFLASDLCLMCVYDISYFIHYFRP